MDIEDTEDTPFGRVQYYADIKYLIDLSSRPNSLSLITLLLGGLGQFFVRLEHEHFPPMTPKNDDFDLHMINWEGMQFIVVIVPLETLPICEQIAIECGVELTKGIPVTMTSHGPERFPLRHERVRFLRPK